MKTLAFTVVVVLASVLPAFAHRTVAKTGDTSTLVSLSGVVTSVRWHTPHVIYHLRDQQ